MSLREVAEKMKGEEEQEILDFSKVISTLKNEDKIINLYDFETYFLPFIIGEIERTDVNTAVYVDNYLKVAKSHHVGIAVKDNDEVKFKLPPLIADTDITKLDNISFGSIVSKVNSYSESRPDKANALLNKVSKKVLEDMGLSDSSKAYIEELVKIFHSYPDRVAKVIEKRNIDVKLDTKQIEEEEDDLFDY
jgi:hypothetical protein